MLNPEPHPLTLRTPHAANGISLRAAAASCARVQLVRAPPEGATLRLGDLVLPREPNRTSGHEPIALWLSPCSWLLVSAHQAPQALLASADAPLQAMRSEHGRTLALTDVSHALVLLELDGPGVRRVLAAGCGLDLRHERFAVGHCAATRFAQLPILLHRGAADRYVLYVDRSLAEWLWEFLVDAAGAAAATPERDAPE